MRMTAIINGTDYAKCFNRLEYAVSFERREGPNGGTMKDGSKTVDLLATKAVITLSTNTMTASQLAELLQELDSEYVYITYTDPRTNADHSAWFIPSVGIVKVAFYRGTTLFWRDGTTITLTEQ